jgi:hypothetical protein
MSRMTLSNLQLRSNLLFEDGYQKEMRRVTALEIKDIWDRNPDLKDGYTPAQQQQKTDSLFYGTSDVRMSDGDRSRAWVELLAQGIEAALTAMEKHPDLERAFEVLCIAEILAAPDLDSTFAAKAAAWAKRVRDVLGRAEFRLEPGMIDQRLADILGRSPPAGPAAGAGKPVTTPLSANAGV